LQGRGSRWIFHGGGCFECVAYHHGKAGTPTGSGAWRATAPLLHRTTRRLSLTEAGTAYFERARRILDDLQDAERAVSDHHATPRRTLRINAPMAFGTTDLSLWLPRFMERYPDLRIDLVCNDRFVNLIEEGFDVALRLARDMPDSSLMARKLAVAPTLLVAFPMYTRAGNGDFQLV
jgi:DNA-binding transcriptional LysR family regulator